MKEAIQVLYSQGGIKSEEYIRYLICKEMNWDYYTFESQPPFFIETILLFMNQEGQKMKQDNQKYRGHSVPPSGRRVPSAKVV